MARRSVLCLQQAITVSRENHQEIQRGVIYEFSRRVILFLTIRTASSRIEVKPTEKGLTPFASFSQVNWLWLLLGWGRLDIAFHSIA